MATHSSILAWKSYGQRSLAGYSPWGHKESDTTEPLHFTSLHKSLWDFRFSVVSSSVAVGEGSGGRMGQREKEREERRGGKPRGLGVGGKRKERGMRENVLERAPALESDN